MRAPPTAADRMQAKKTAVSTPATAVRKMAVREMPEPPTRVSTAGATAAPRATVEGTAVEMSRPLLVLGCLALVGCAGSLDDPAAFLAAATSGGTAGETGSGSSGGGSSTATGTSNAGSAGGGTTGGGSTGGGTTGSPLPNCDAPTQVFEVSCATCHGPAPLNLGALDLISPGVESRLVGVTAPLCGTETYVIPGQPAQSYVYQKVSEARPPCGSRMPQSGSLSAADQQCVAGWIANLDGGG
jgi:hypothetical protein